MRRAIEIHNVAANAMLTAKFISCQTLEAKHSPQLGFGIRGLPSHCPGEFQ
jgi:hypothetical protein